MESLLAERDLDQLIPSGWLPLGDVAGFIGPIIRANIFGASRGALCEIEGSDYPVKAVVVSCRGGQADLLPFENSVSPRVGSAVRIVGSGLDLFSRHVLPGRAISALGAPLSFGVCAPAGQVVKLDPRKSPPTPNQRKPIKERLTVGVKAIDCLCPIGFGQKIGIIAEAGAGKSTLLGMIARNANVDVCVIGLVGERGREVVEFIEGGLGPAMFRTLLVVSTSDEPPFQRALAPFTAAAAAEHFAAQGLNVLLLIDSLTRAARAMRDVGLASGEIPVRQGYTPGVYSELPRLIEKAGNFTVGSITAVYTLLANSSQDIDPLSEELKSLLDGHIILNPAAARGYQPAIELGASISRTAGDVLSPHELSDLELARVLSAEIKELREITLLSGTPSERASKVLALEPRFAAFLNQGRSETVPLQAATAELKEIMAKYRALGA